MTGSVVLVKDGTSSLRCSASPYSQLPFPFPHCPQTGLIVPRRFRPSDPLPCTKKSGGVGGRGRRERRIRNLGPRNFFSSLMHILHVDLPMGVLCFSITSFRRVSVLRNSYNGGRTGTLPSSTGLSEWSHGSLETPGPLYLPPSDLECQETQSSLLPTPDPHSPDIPTTFDKPSGKYRCLVVLNSSRLR